jgi:hypothetical protein
MGSLIFRKLTEWASAYQRTTPLDESDRLFVHRDGDVHGRWCRPSVIRPPITVNGIWIGNSTLTTSLSELFLHYANVSSEQGPSVVTATYQAIAVIQCSDGEGSRLNSYAEVYLTVGGYQAGGGLVGLELPTISNPGVVRLDLRVPVTLNAAAGSGPGNVPVKVEAKHVNAVSAVLYSQRLIVTTTPGATFAFV